MRPLNRLCTALATGILLVSTASLGRGSRDRRTRPGTGLGGPRWPNAAAGGGHGTQRAAIWYAPATGARAYLMLAEGSRVKLGEAARFGLHTRSMQPQKTFRGALDVIAGAFRFTTGKLKKSVPRDVAIRVGTATIGIRGTDVWGKTDKDGDLVALLEGKHRITRAGQATEMSQP
jgi:hypothetical protein